MPQSARQSDRERLNYPGVAGAVFGWVSAVAHGIEVFDHASREMLIAVAAVVAWMEGPARLHTMLDTIKARDLVNACEARRTR